ncbi:hypothetical protein MYAM1_003206 [Malassezia yamatoensis]|uniref:Uncharacterized protein n=1 Tax=Malassezia yamatoensis TaxID=253288 RepID=A0AAJ5YVD2_9BASI|nr:hypothetical protein MYAM1_003206 [Malassezia yamatoensis]
MQEEAPSSPALREQSKGEYGETDEPPRILYEMPDELARDAAAERVEEDVTHQEPAQEIPEPGSMPERPPLEAGEKLRIEALHLEGEPISQLSTSRLMAYVASTGSRARGIEWISDNRCVLVFDSYGDALAGMQRIQLPRNEVDMEDEPAAPEPSELASVGTIEAPWNDAIHALLTPRLAMAFPSELYNMIEKQSLSELPEAEKQLQEARSRLESGSEPVPEIYRDMEIEELERRTLTRDLKHVKQLRQSLWIRFALAHHDTKAPRSAQRSNWYRQHGRGAGKDVVPRLLEVGEHASQQPGRRDRRDIARNARPSYYDEDPYTRPRESMREAENAWEEEDYRPRSLLDRISGNRDEEEPVSRPRSRSASPQRNTDRDSGIRGRGSVRAPRSRMHGWDD